VSDFDTVRRFLDDRDVRLLHRGGGWEMAADDARAALARIEASHADLLAALEELVLVMAPMGKKRALEARAAGDAAIAKARGEA